MMKKSEKEALVNKFREWCKREKADIVTRKVCGSLLNEYMKGNPEPLFGKRYDVEKREFYRLAAIFHSLLIYLGLNNEYLIFKSKIT